MDFDEECRLTKARNLARLQSLGLGGSILPPIKKATKPKAPRKRKAEVLQNNENDAQGNAPNKAAKVESGEDGVDGLRRSSRNRGKTVDYKDDGSNNTRGLIHTVSSKAAAKEMGSEPRNARMRIHDPKQYGAIPGIAIGTWWEKRDECSIDAVHAPVVAGIAFSPQGAYSVALSGGYEDDVDLGEAFTYTGSGGRDLKGTKNAPKNLRTAPQSSDQSFEHPPNAALKRSCETKKPVRVIRGYKLRSAYAPVQGYRYDGLYTVEKAWMEKGLNPKGYLVCKYALKRVPGQAPLQLTNGPLDEASDDEDVKDEEE